MDRDQLARGLAALTAVAVLAGLGFQIHATYTGPAGFFSSRAERVGNIFCFFTILSNLLLAATSAALAVRLDRRSPIFSGLRLSGVLSMVVTGVVYHLALRNLHELNGTGAVANDLLHTVDPILAVLGWLVIGPRRVISARVVWLSIVYPVGWLIGTLIRGAIVNFYPYPFLNATEHGYATVTGNCVLVAVLFLGLAAGAARLDRLLPPRPAAD